MQMIISGTRMEFLEFVKGIGINEKLEDLIKKMVFENQIDEEVMQEWFEDVSWSTFYLAHLIVVKTEALYPEQINDRGAYLTIDQLGEYELEERSVRSRVGGSRKVCRRLKIEDVLFIKKAKNERRCYVAKFAISTIPQLAEDEDFKQDYEDFLDGIVSCLEEDEDE